MLPEVATAIDGEKILAGLATRTSKQICDLVVRYKLNS
jgi:hypothetical protein